MLEIPGAGVRLVEQVEEHTYFEGCWSVLEIPCVTDDVEDVTRV